MSIGTDIHEGTSPFFIQKSEIISMSVCLESRAKNIERPLSTCHLQSVEQILSGAIIVRARTLT